MEAEYLLVVTLALLMVCFAMLTITAWNNAPESRITVIKNVFQYLLGLVSNVGIALFYWSDGIDYAALMGPISLQAILFFFAIALSVLFINDMQDLEEKAAVAI
jgi:hypothetical protein